MDSQPELGSTRLAVKQGLCRARQGVLPHRLVALQQRHRQQQQGGSHRIARTFLVWQTLARLTQGKSPLPHCLRTILTKGRARQTNPQPEQGNMRLASEQGLCHARQGAPPRRSVALRQQRARSFYGRPWRA